MLASPKNLLLSDCLNNLSSFFSHSKVPLCTHTFLLRCGELSHSNMSADQSGPSSPSVFTATHGPGTDQDFSTSNDIRNSSTLCMSDSNVSARSNNSLASRKSRSGRRKYDLRWVEQQMQVNDDRIVALEGMVRALTQELSSKPSTSKPEQRAGDIKKRSKRA